LFLCVYIIFIFKVADLVNKNIFFLGDKLSFHHLAAISYFGADNIFSSAPSFDAIIEKIKLTKDAFGIIAVHNTIAGDVPDNYERICKSGLNIHSSIKTPVQLHLAARTDLQLSEIYMVYSHEMAILQTSDFFLKAPHIQFTRTASTASAIKLVSESSETGIAAIGNKAAIQFYGLQVIAENIDNLAENFTRFLILSNISTETQTTNLPVIASIHLQKVDGWDGAFSGLSTAKALKKELSDGSFYFETIKILPEQLFNLLAKINQNGIKARVLGIYQNGEV